MKEPVLTPNAPASIGPFAQAVKAGGFLFISGQLPVHPETGEQYVGTLRAQTARVIANVQAIAEAAGATLADVVRVTLYVHDLDNLLEINETFARCFGDHPPACTVLQAARLYRDAGVQMDAVVKLRG